MLRFGPVLDFFRWLAPRRASSGPARVGGRSCESRKRSFEEFQRVKRFKRESAHTGTSFLTVRFWTSPTGGWSNQSVGTGRSPACTATFARHFHVTKNKLFTHVLKLLSGLHIYNITTFVILLIHTFLQPFIQV